MLHIVDLWDDYEINPETFRIYARNVSAKEAPRNFIFVDRLHSNIDRNQKKSIDLQQRMYSNDTY